MKAYFVWDVPRRLARGTYSVTVESPTGPFEIQEAEPYRYER
jgi:hypothetical protein